MPFTARSLFRTQKEEQKRTLANKLHFSTRRPYIIFTRHVRSGECVSRVPVVSCTELNQLITFKSCKHDII